MTSPPGAPRNDSVWLATAEADRYVALEGDRSVDVAVVGAGITGLTTALMLQEDGASVAVIEAGRIGAGTTGHTTGKVTSQHGLIYADMISRHGERPARHYALANQDAVATVASLSERTAADCRLQRAPAFVYTSRPEHRAAIHSEHHAALRLGLPSALTTATDLPFPIDSAVRFDDQIHLHPGRYLAALARTVAAGGGLVFERTRGTAVEERTDHAILRTSGGEVRTRHVVLATLLPFVDHGGFFARTRPGRSYGIAARIRGRPLTGMHIGVAPPIHSTRPWNDGDRPGVIVVGESHPAGQPGTTAGHWHALEQWADRHFEVESVRYRWSSQDYATPDGLPYVGRSPRTTRTLVATGFAKWGLTNGTAAAGILADMIAGRDNPWLPAFDATRIGDLAAVANVVADNLAIGGRFVQDRIARWWPGRTSELAPGEAGMVEIGGRTVGAYRDETGGVHAVSITCTHLGCTLRWNGAEQSWDCPCHGSRFGPDGAVLDGPATRPLERIEPREEG